jgi:hypothetical protein
VSIRVLTLELVNGRLNGSFKLAITLLIAPSVFSLVDHYHEVRTSTSIVV